MERDVFWFRESVRCDRLRALGAHCRRRESLRRVKLRALVAQRSQRLQVFVCVIAVIQAVVATSSTPDVCTIFAYKNRLLGLAEDCMPLLTPSPSLDSMFVVNGETFIRNGFRLLSCTAVNLRFKCACVFDEFFINEDLFIFMTFSGDEAELCHPGCRASSNRSSLPGLTVASSLCTPPLPALRLRPGRWCTWCKVPNVQREVLEFNVSLSRHRCFWSWGVVWARWGTSQWREGQARGRRSAQLGGRPILTLISTVMCRRSGRLPRQRRAGGCWCPVVRRVMLHGALVEVSSWNAPSWCSRSWYATVHCARRQGVGGQWVDFRGYASVSVCVSVSPVHVFMSLVAVCCTSDSRTRSFTWSRRFVL